MGRKLIRRVKNMMFPALTIFPFSILHQNLLTERDAICVTAGQGQTTAAHHPCITGGWHQDTWQRTEVTWHRSPDSTWPHGQWMAVSPLNFLFNGSLEVTTQSCPGKDSGVLVQTTDNRHITAHFIPHSWIKTRKGSGKTIISEARKLFQYKISIIHVAVSPS